MWIARWTRWTMAAGFRSRCGVDDGELRDDRVGVRGSRVGSGRNLAGVGPARQRLEQRDSESERDRAQKNEEMETPHERAFDRGAGAHRRPLVVGTAHLSSGLGIRQSPLRGVRLGLYNTRIQGRPKHGADCPEAVFSDPRWSAASGKSDRRPTSVNPDVMRYRTLLLLLTLAFVLVGVLSACGGGGGGGY